MLLLNQRSNKSAFIHTKILIIIINKKSVMIKTNENTFKCYSIVCCFKNRFSFY